MRLSIVLGLLGLSLPPPSGAATRVAVFPFYAADPAGQSALIELTARLGHALSQRPALQILPPDRVREIAARMSGLPHRRPEGR